MPFTGVFGLGGQYLTYRDYWALTLGSYAGVQIMTGAIVSILCHKYGYWNSERKGSLTPLHFKLISSTIALFYAIILVLAAVVNGLMVFGGQSMYIYLGVLLVVQTIFVLLAIFVRIPYLSEFILSVSNWSIAGGVFFLIQLPSMLDYAGQNLTWIIAIAASVPLVLKAAITNVRVTQSRDIGWLERLKLARSRIHFWITLVVVMGLGIFIAFFLAGTCITIYDPDVNGAWIPFGGTVRWSSRLMRSWSYNKFCTGTDPCHVYLTAGRDLTSEIFVTVHVARGSAKSLSINLLNTIDGSIIDSVEATEFDMPLLDMHDDRLVFSAFLSDLPAGSEVGFSISTDESVSIGESAYYFKTADPGGSFSFVVAGDSGVTSDAFAIMNQMTATNVGLAVIGGDIVYDNGFVSCACSWDQWLTSWEGNRVNNKYMVPLAFAAGNHDLGINDNNDGAFDAMSGSACDLTQTVHAKPLFFAWFPFEVDTTTKDILPICDRSTLHLHSIPNLLNLWMLDTAYVASVQANIDFVSENYPGSGANIAAYHVPLYSSNVDDASLGEYLITAWAGPLFDTFEFAMCFEHHAHTYKRTKPLYNNAIATNKGTVYLGDGKMGIGGMAVPDSSGVIQPSDTNFFENTGTQYHFFSVEIEGQIQVSAIDTLGNTFDSLTVQ